MNRFLNKKLELYAYCCPEFLIAGRRSLLLWERHSIVVRQKIDIKSWRGVQAFGLKQFINLALRTRSLSSSQFSSSTFLGYSACG